MSVFGSIAGGRWTGPTYDEHEQQKLLAQKKVTALSDEVKKLELALANKLMQLESAKAHAKSFGDNKPHSRRASLGSVSEEVTSAGQQNGRRKSRSSSRSRDFCYKIKEIRFAGADCDILIEQGPCIAKIGLSHFMKDQDKQLLAKLADAVNAKGISWGRVGLLLWHFNSTHAVQSCGSDTYTIVLLDAR